MNTLGQYSFVVGSALQVAAYLVLAVMALVRLGRPWAVIALLGALTSLVPTVWFAAANAIVQFSDGASFSTVDFFYAPAAQLLMQLLTVLGVVLLVAAVLMGRGPRREAPVEGPTGTTFRQLPGNIDWK